MQTVFYVYAHYTKDTNELFYIGKGKDNRCHSFSGRNKYWKNVVNKHGFIVKKLKQNISEILAFKYEMYYIRTLKPKCNLSLGGAGGHTWVSYSNKEKKKVIEKCSEAKSRFWKTKNPEERSKLMRNSRVAVKKMWANMCPIKKSEEQKRRNSFKKKIPVYCITNGVLYSSAKEAANSLGIKNEGHIHRVANGYRPHCYNYKFQYVTSDNPTLPIGKMT